MSRKLVFLKLGGSLITDKNQPYTPRLEVLRRLAGEIAEALASDQALQIVLGHGSGSFGHYPASKYKTRLGVKSVGEWKGFVEVRHEAAELNHLVMAALVTAGLPAIAFPPSATVISSHGQVEAWNLEPLQRALDNGLMPVIFGDVTFDKALGGTILSTEDLFAYLVRQIIPSRLLLAGDQPGVWGDYPQNTRLLAEINRASFPQVKAGLSGSAATDVTGGMAEKVRQVMAMVESAPGLQASIFSGAILGNVRRSLLGESLGTQVHGY